MGDVTVGTNQDGGHLTSFDSAKGCQLGTPDKGGSENILGGA